MFITYYIKKFNIPKLTNIQYIKNNVVLAIGAKIINFLNDILEVPANQQTKAYGIGVNAPIKIA